VDDGTTEHPLCAPLITEAVQEIDGMNGIVVQENPDHQHLLISYQGDTGAKTNTAGTSNVHITGTNDNKIISVDGGGGPGDSYWEAAGRPAMLRPVADVRKVIVPDLLVNPGSPQVVGSVLMNHIECDSIHTNLLSLPTDGGALMGDITEIDRIYIVNND
jgi:hypothetical protein